VTIASRVPVELADAIRTLADSGNRSVSREIAHAVQRHVNRSGGSLSGSTARSPAERREPSEVGRSGSQAHTGGDA
jgi:hypothetical protein